MILTPAALLPANEPERLQALQYYELLPVLQEEVFDELVTLSAQLFGLPICYVGLLDGQQLHYKATHGLPPLPPQPRQDVLCSQVVRQNQVVLYHDLAATDPAPLDAPAIQNALNQHVRFYVGAPLRVPGEHAIGTLCLVDQQPRTFSAAEQQALEHLAAVIAQAVVLRHECRHAPELGEARWQQVGAQLREEVNALGALVRYLLTRYGLVVPVPEEVLHLIVRRLHDLRRLLQEEG